MKRSEIGRSSTDTASTKSAKRGQLRIGNDWHAISIIAQSQSNPLKAIAEFVENSIDARANQIAITRGKQRGAHYLRITDDGEGIRKNAEGTPDFAYVATHICDSIKRELKRHGEAGFFLRMSAAVRSEPGPGSPPSRQQSVPFLGDGLPNMVRGDGCSSSTCQ